MIKFCKDISTLDDLESGLHNPLDIELVMTIAHDHVLAPSDLGFEVRSDAHTLAPRSDADLRDGAGGALDAEDRRDLNPDAENVVPAAVGEAEPPVEERHVL